MRILNNVNAVQYNTSSSHVNTNDATSFQDVMHLQFSKHANMRLNTREISLSEEQIQRVESGVSRAKEKGIRDSLVLVDNVALVVNTKNNIVITAMNQNQTENIYTNIDGAVIV